ncbi:MAG: hypothetical protein WC901_07345 [Candidatus Margulisiibacteriota bacterium]
MQSLSIQDVPIRYRKYLKFGDAQGNGNGKIDSLDEVKYAIGYYLGEHKAAGKVNRFVIYVNQQTDSFQTVQGVKAEQLIYVKGKNGEIVPAPSESLAEPIPPAQTAAPEKAFPKPGFPFFRRSVGLTFKSNVLVLAKGDETMVFGNLPDELLPRDYNPDNPSSSDPELPAADKPAFREVTEPVNDPMSMFPMVGLKLFGFLTAGFGIHHRLFFSDEPNCDPSLGEKKVDCIDNSIYDEARGDYAINQYLYLAGKTKIPVAGFAELELPFLSFGMRNLGSSYHYALGLQADVGGAAYMPFKQNVYIINGIDFGNELEYVGSREKVGELSYRAHAFYTDLMLAMKIGGEAGLWSVGFSGVSLGWVSSVAKFKAEAAGMDFHYSGSRKDEFCVLPLGIMSISYEGYLKSR